MCICTNILFQCSCNPTTNQPSISLYIKIVELDEIVKPIWLTGNAICKQTWLTGSRNPIWLTSYNIWVKTRKTRL